MISKVFSIAENAFEFFFDFIMKSGVDRTGTKAIFDVSLKIQYPLESEITTPWRQWDKSYAELEYAWYKTGVRDPSMVAERAKIWRTITDPANGEVNSNYGAMWLKNDQLNRVIKMLKLEPLTRRAVILHYDINEMDRYKYDTPCNIVLNFYIQDGMLHLTIFARSIDLVYGFCNDQFCFSKLMDEVASELGTVVGSMTFMITNLHIYEKHWYINERHTKEVPKKSKGRVSRKNR